MIVDADVFSSVICCSMEDDLVSGVEGCFLWIEILMVDYIDGVLNAYARKRVPGLNQVDW